MKKTSSRVGFTLVELLLVVALLGVVGLIVYGTFARGFSIWRRVAETPPTEDVSLLFRNISYDLRNSFQMTGLKFEGDTTEVSFPVRTKYRQKEGIKDSIGFVTYSFDSRKNAVFKSQASYSEAYHGKAGPKRVIAEGIRLFKLEYFVYDAEKDTRFWKKSWQKSDSVFGREKEEYLPLIVKLKVGIPAESGEQVFTKMIFVPSGCCWPFVDEDKK